MTRIRGKVVIARRVAVIANREVALVIASPKWRSNPAGEGIHAGLLRSALPSGPLAVTGESCHCEPEVAKQSSRGRYSHWIASLGN
ncbi:MAG: hypothetical protein LBT00_02900 [Spirochaetaceae bacterium]|nr:hypothetical protein [Spirochaetaceae bacterium]